MSNDPNGPNPYASAPAPIVLGAASPDVKPQSLIVFGILNLVFGALGVLGLVFVLIQLVVDMPQPNNPLQDIMNDPTYKVVTGVAQVVGGILTIIELISGVGLIQGKAYGRKLAIIFAISYLIIVVLGTIFNIFYVSMPVFTKADEMVEGPEKIAAMVAASTVFIQPFCLGLYPVLLLIFMNRASVKNYLAKHGQ